jgi:transposase
MRAGISITLSSADRQRLQAIIKDRNAAQKHVWQAGTVLLSADGVGANGIMRQTGTSKTCVWRWQERFSASGARTGFSHTACACSSSPTIRTPSRNCDVVGLYVDPPAHAIVLSVDEKSQIQALDRTQPGLPMKKGRAGTLTHDYKRNGTTTLFAALNVLDGKVIGRNMQRHRHQEFILFLNAIEAEVPAGKVVHVILDNYAAHKHPKVRHWLHRHERFTFHFTPTSCSWLNAVEGFFDQAHRASVEARHLPINRRPSGRHPSLSRRAQRKVKTLHLDRRSRQNHRRRQTRSPI